MHSRPVRLGYFPSDFRINAYTEYSAFINKQEHPDMFTHIWHFLTIRTLVSE